MQVPVESSLVEASRVVQLRALFWSMRKVIAGAQRDANVGKAFLFELQSLATPALRWRIA